MKSTAETYVSSVTICSNLILDTPEDAIKILGDIIVFSLMKFRSSYTSESANAYADSMMKELKHVLEEREAVE